MENFVLLSYWKADNRVKVSFTAWECSFTVPNKPALSTVVILALPYKSESLRSPVCATATWPFSAKYIFKLFEGHIIILQTKPVEWFTFPHPFLQLHPICKKEQTATTDTFRLEISTVCRNTTNIESCNLKQVKKSECMRRTSRFK